MNRLMVYRRIASRRLLAGAVALGMTLALGACGFALRQTQTLPFRTITLSNFASDSPLANELAQALEASGVDVVETTAQAAAAATAKSASLSGHAILQAGSDTRDQVVASTTSFGQVRDLSLRTRFKFTLLRADGSVWLPETDLQLARDLTYNEKDALAKQAEAEALHRAMQTDIVPQVMRRLASVNATAAQAR